MSTSDYVHTQPVTPRDNEPRIKTKGEVYEGIAFNFCKAATILLLTLPLQKFALPAVAGAAAIFYLLAHLHGQHDTRCILRIPLLIAVFWGTICLGSLYLIWLKPS